MCSSPQLSYCSSTQAIHGCRARQETCQCSKGRASWLAEPPKKSEKSGLKYQSSGEVLKPGACSCCDGQQPEIKGGRVSWTGGTARDVRGQQTLPMLCWLKPRGT